MVLLDFLLRLLEEFGSCEHSCSFRAERLPRRRRIRDPIAFGTGMVGVVTYTGDSCVVVASWLEAEVGTGLASPASPEVGVVIGAGDSCVVVTSWVEAEVGTVVGVGCRSRSSSNWAQVVVNSAKRNPPCAMVLTSKGKSLFMLHIKM